MNIMDTMKTISELAKNGMSTPTQCQDRKKGFLTSACGYQNGDLVSTKVFEGHTISAKENIRDIFAICKEAFPEARGGEIIWIRAKDF